MIESLRRAMTCLLLAPLCAHAGPVARDAELEQRGAHIGNIEIEVDDVFENGTHLAAPYRVANNLHISTHESTVQQQLLFHRGDVYDRRVLDETARMLRAQRYLNEASVEPVRYNEADNTVDVLVRVHDVWTLSPGLSFGRKGGENSTRVKFADTNFLGLGKELSLARSSDVDRSAWELGYVDPNVFGSGWKLAAGYSSLSDGSEKKLSLERPFYAMDTRWSAGFAAADATTAVSRYSLGHVVERLQMQERKFDIGGGFSEGLHDGWTTRYLGGLRYDAREFQARADEPDASIPADRVVAYPWVGIEVMEDQYVATRNLDQIGRTEDLYLGLSARLEAGFASTVLGSTHDAAILNGVLQAGADLGHEQYLIHSLGFHTRVEGDALANASIDWSTRYYLRQSVHRVFFASVSGTVTSHRDPEEQLLLGGDNGLRGYPLRYQAGDQSALVTLEQRFYTDWQPLKLVNVGAAVFVDSGRTWGRDPFAAPPAGWLTDVGVGLRLGSARSGLGNVLHIDLAFPLNRTSDIDSVQLLVETKRSF
jgi:outer membrane protein assembly factor BamA